MHHKWLTLVFISLLGGGCSWFTWLPWVDDPEGPDLLEPAKLVKFDAEIRIKRLWKVSIGEGLGKKYLRLNPVILADRIFAPDTLAADRIYCEASFVCTKCGFRGIRSGESTPQG